MIDLFATTLEAAEPMLEVLTRFGMAGAACWFLIKDRERLVSSLKEEQDAHIASMKEGYEKRLEWLEEAHRRLAEERDETQRALNAIHERMLSNRERGGCGTECMTNGHE